METAHAIQLYVGDVVRRLHPWDGSSGEGAAVGPLLTVTKLYPGEPFAVCMLSDGRSELECNLERFEISLN